MNARQLVAARRRSRGIVLPTVLIMLLILSVAAVVISEQISTQTRMVGNSANTDISVQAAEAVLRYATSQLVAGTFTESQFRANAAGLYYFNAASYSATVPLPWQTTAGWKTALIVPKSVFGDVTSSELYMIEELPPVITPGGSTQKAYRITAQVVGMGGQGTVILQTLYKI
jgi:Tfp pilus assembly protein PilX